MKLIFCHDLHIFSISEATKSLKYQEKKIYKTFMVFDKREIFIFLYNNYTDIQKKIELQDIHGI